MATFVAPHPVASDARKVHRAHGSGLSFALALVSALTLFAAAVAGYHPYAEDGGLYAAGIKRLLDPALYPHGTGFVLAPTQYSLFAPTVAAIVRATHLPLPVVLLVLYLGSLWATLFAAWMLAARCWQFMESRVGAVALLACWISLPIAGTALFFIDPYLTARSISTPCMILALVGALDLTGIRDGNGSRRRGFLIWATSLCVAGAVHPLMAGYAGAASASLIWIRSVHGRLRVWGWVGSCSVALALAGFAQHVAMPETAAYVHIALTRSYWFLEEWRWYELAGLLAPMAILAVFALRPLKLSRYLTPATTVRDSGAASALAQMGVGIGILAFTVSLFFVRPGLPIHIVARIQPLRVFQTVYLVMVLALGAALGENFLRRTPWRWITALFVLGGTMIAASRSAYPASPHMEIASDSAPATDANDWVRAFVWIRDNTPKDALFALDADYIHASGEDAHCFRAIAERSALADYSKDGGEASIALWLTDAWTPEQAAQQGLNRMTDFERTAVLAPMRVNWMVLDAQTSTSSECPYRNGSVQVCRLQDFLDAGLAARTYR